MPHVFPARAGETKATVPATPILERERHAYAILLWQQAQEKPTIDLAKYKKDIEEVIGKEEIGRLEALPENEKEALRFSAERLHASSGTFARDADELLRILHVERTRGQLVEATRALEQAEATGKSGEQKRLEGDVRLYTEQLAQLHKKP